MVFGGGRWTLVFNGEIYNYRQLAKEVRRHQFVSSGDAEVLGALLAEQPVEKVLPMLRGMFAFAWWDAQERSLVAARDAFGIKSLYYTDAGGELRFGSELHAVAALQDQPGKLNPAALADYLRWGAVQAPETILDGFRCLPPGHLLRWKDGRTQVERWHLPAWPGPESWITDKREQLAMTRETVLQSVEAHLVSDVPVGVFLSAGLDSTLMAASMKHLGQQEVQAFSIGYEENAGVPDETDAAERTAKFLGCGFVRERITADAMERDLDAYFASLDQPTGDALNTWLVSRVAARHVKVALSGLGADEWFGGYNSHRLICLSRLNPLSAATGPLARCLAAMLPLGLSGQRLWKIVYHALSGAGVSVAQAHEAMRTILDPGQISKLTGCSDSSWTSPSVSGGSWLQELLLRETQTYLPNTLLRDNDVTSMAHSLELRVPLVDREVFTLAGRLPDDAKLNLFTGKRVLREAFADLLPDWIARDTKKKTFTLPLMKWMQQPKWKERIHDTVLAPSARLYEHLDPAAVRGLVSRFESQTGSSKASWHLSQPVWMLLVLESWLQRNTAS